MKEELRHHLLPLAVIFFVTSVFWVLFHYQLINLLPLFLGLSLGSFLLDTDHLVYWFFLNPKLDESRQAKAFWQKKDFKSLLSLLEFTHKNHTSLIFHHYFFQTILALTSIFIFTSSGSIFTKSLILAMNIHLLVDEIVDFRANPRHLRTWLFAREDKQLPLNYLKYYLYIFSVFCFFFLLFLIKSK